MKRLLKSLKTQFDLVIIDCPPGINTVTEQAYRAASKVLVPLTPTPLCLESFRALSVLLKEVAIPETKLKAFFNRVDSRLALHQTSLKRFSETGTAHVLGWIRHTTLVEQMALEKRAVTDTHPAHLVSRDFDELWKSLMRELNLHH